MPVSPVEHRTHSRNQSLQDAIPPPANEAPAEQAPVNALHMAFPGNMPMPHPTFGESGPPSPQDTSELSVWSNADSGDEQGGTSYSSIQQPADGQQGSWRRRRRSSGPFPSSASIDFGQIDELHEANAMAVDRGMTAAVISPELKAKLDETFLDFLNQVCSNRKLWPALSLPSFSCIFTDPLLAVTSTSRGDGQPWRASSPNIDAQEDGSS